MIYKIVKPGNVNWERENESGGNHSYETLGIKKIRLKLYFFKCKISVQLENVNILESKVYINYKS